MTTMDMDVVTEGDKITIAFAATQASTEKRFCCYLNSRNLWTGDTVFYYS